MAMRFILYHCTGRSDYKCCPRQGIVLEDDTPKRHELAVICATRFDGPALILRTEIASLRCQGSNADFLSKLAQRCDEHFYFTAPQPVEVPGDNLHALDLAFALFYRFVLTEYEGRSCPRPLVSEVPHLLEFYVLSLA